MGRRLAEAVTGIDFIASHFGVDGKAGDPVLIKMLELHRDALGRAVDGLGAMLKALTPPIETGGPGNGDI